MWPQGILNFSLRLLLSILMLRSLEMIFNSFGFLVKRINKVVITIIQSLLITICINARIITCCVYIRVLLYILQIELLLIRRQRFTLFLILKYLRLLLDQIFIITTPDVFVILAFNSMLLTKTLFGLRQFGVVSF